MTKKNIPIGVDNFAKLVDKQKNYLFADKTLFIKAILKDSAEVTLITRPRRWGKTMNMSMLHYFLASEVYGIKTQGLFDSLKIAQEADGGYLKHQGQYPVIFITFKDVKENTYENALNKIKVLIQNLYRDHKKHLLNSDNLDDNDKDLYKRQLSGNINEQELGESIKFLSELLHKHYGKEVYILIDEYDTPLNAAYQKEFFGSLSLFLKNMLSAALKGNPYLAKGVMTGILRISKDSMLSGLNNLEVYSLLDEDYDEYFGFTEAEVKALFEAQQLTHEITAIRQYYNGYQVADTVLYNPWSIMSCIKKGGELKPYWVNTADDSLLQEALLAASDTAKDQFGQLIAGQPIEVSVSDTIHFNNIATNDTSLWSLLLAAGYLTCTAKKSVRTAYQCTLIIPNEEVSGLYIDIFAKWLENKIGGNNYQSFIKSLVSGDYERFAEQLGNYLVRYTSGHDFPRESNYHTFMLGLVCSVTDTHLLYSNIESGVGRPDILLVPKVGRVKAECKDLGIILEFKHAKTGHEQDKLAKAALDQIDSRHYQAALEQNDHVKRILKVGIAFVHKSVWVAGRIDNKDNEPLSELFESQESLVFDEESSDSDERHSKKRKKKIVSDESSEESSDSQNETETKRRRLETKSVYNKATKALQFFQPLSDDEKETKAAPSTPYTPKNN